MDPPEVNDMEVDDAISDLEFDATHAWNPRDSVIIGKMADYLSKGEDVLVKVGELEAYL